MQVDPRIISAIAAPGGAFDSDLAAFAVNYTDQVAHLTTSGFPIVETAGPGGRRIYRLNVETCAVPRETVRVKDIETRIEADVMVAPPDIKPPADAPSSQETEPEAEPEQPADPEPPPPTATPRDLVISFAASDFKLQSRDAATPKVYLIPANEEAAAAALQFSMRRPRGSIITVTLQVRGITRKGVAKAVAAAVGDAATAIADRSTAQETEGGDMPIYEYACTACAHEFEELQSVADGGTAKCPECGAAAERRISIPQPAIIREKAAKPAEKGKAQIEKELGEQVNNGEIPAGLANAQAKMASL